MGRFSKLETHAPAPAAAKAEAEDKTAYGTETVTYETMMRDADALFYTGDYRKALRLYSRALQSDNTKPAPWVGQILALLIQSQVSEAAVWAQRAMVCFPNLPAMLSLHGLVLAMQGTVKRGLGTSDYAMGLGKADVTCWIARGWILVEADNANWEFCFTKVDEMSLPDAWQTHMLVGLILERYKKWPHAVARYQKAAEIQTANFFLWKRLAHCYGKLGLARKAFEAQQHALELNPRCIEKARGFSPLDILSRVFHLFSRSSK